MMIELTSFLRGFRFIISKQRLFAIFISSKANFNQLMQVSRPMMFIALCRWRSKGNHYGHPEV
jgi:hypothetical protein